MLHSDKKEHKKIRSSPPFVKIRGIFSRRTIIVVLIGFAVIFYAPWFVITEKTVQSIIQNSFSHEGLRIEIGDMRKGVFYNFFLKELTLSGFHGEYLSLHDIRGFINPLSLFLFHLNISFEGGIGEGNIAGKMNLVRNHMKIRLDFSKAPIEDIPLIQHAGIKGKGTLSGRFSMINGEGHMEISTENAELQQAALGTAQVPLNFFHDITCSADIKGNSIHIVSMYFEGRDIHARLKGTIRNAFMDLTMEVMPGRSFLENPFFLAELEKYRISPGYYNIPVRGNLTY